MKRNILLWLCLYASLCQAQEVSLRVADSWVSLKMEEMQTEIKPGWSIAGKKLKDTRVLYLWGKSSRQVTDDRKPVLKVEPGERETLVDYALVQLKRRRDHRRLAKSFATTSMCAWSRPSSLSKPTASSLSCAGRSRIWHLASMCWCGSARL